VFYRKNKRYGVFSAVKAHKNRILARTKTHLRFLQIKKYIMEKRQELAENAPDKEKQEKAMQVAAKYQQIV